jgi:hypothetical protein
MRYRRLDHLLVELRKSALGAALPAGIIVVLIGVAISLSWSLAVTIGVSTALTVGVLVVAEHRLERQARNVADSAMIFSLLGSCPPALGTWAIEADFGQLIARELTNRPEAVIECGSGVTTLIIAACLRANGSGRLYSLEHDPAYARQTALQLDAAGLGEWVDLIVAPLIEQEFGLESVAWYDLSIVVERLPSVIDLVVVDGPPSTSRSARWPAMDVLYDRLVTQGVVLLDDGRQRRERRAAFRWQGDLDLQLFWHDTVKGSWMLVKLAKPRNETLWMRLGRRLIRSVYPRPSGFGR